MKKKETPTRGEQSKAASNRDSRRAPSKSEGGIAAVAQPATQPNQLDAFNAAMRLFHGRKFAQAKDAFEKATQGPRQEIAEKATQLARICEQKLADSKVELKGADDHYNFGVALLNARNLDTARQHLETAVRLKPDADHFHYAMALCQALGGNVQGAYESLTRAIELEPRNRIAARQDADFQAFAQQAPFDVLLYPERAQRF